MRYEFEKRKTIAKLRYNDELQRWEIVVLGQVKWYGDNEKELAAAANKEGYTTIREG